MRLLSGFSGVLAGFAIFAAQATTLPPDMLPGFAPENLIDPDGAPNDFGLSRSEMLQALENARRDFASALDLLEDGLGANADYGSILALAPDLRSYAGESGRLLWMHALALAATGELAEAEATLARAASVADGSDSPLPLLAEAMLRFRQGDPDRATMLVEQAVGRAPAFAYSHNLLGIVQAARGDNPAARAGFAEAARLAPGSLVYLRNLGITEFALDRMDPALEALDAALEIAPDDCTALLAKAQIFEAAQRIEGAVNLVGRCLAANPDEARVAGYLVSLQVAQGAYQVALDTISRFEATLPEPRLLQAEVYLMMNRPTEAREMAGAAGGSAASLFRTALADAMAGDLAAAATALESLRSTEIASDPRVALADVALSVATGAPIAPEVAERVATEPAVAAAVAWYRAVATAPQGSAGMSTAADLLPGVRFEGVPDSDWQALADPETRASAALGMLWLLFEFDLATAEAFSDVLARAEVQQARYFGAIADVRLGAPNDALDRLRPAADAAPGYFSAQNLLGELHLGRGQLPDALASYQRAVAVVEDPGALMRIGLLADHLDDVPVAEDALRRYIALFPDSFIGYNQLAWVFIQREMRLDEAEALAETADRLQPENASVLDNLGWVRHLRDDTEGALPLLREANRRSGESNPDILYHLAVVEAATGETEASRALIERLEAVTPAGHPVLERVEDLRAQLP